MQNFSKEHFSGIDILRCLAMFMIVILHILYHGKILNNISGIQSLPYEFLESLCYGAVDLFAMISGYLLVFSKWKLSRYFILYVQVAFYTILFAFIAKYFDGKSLSAKDWLQAIVAVIGNYWYITAYIGVLTIMPILNAFLRELDIRLNYKAAGFCLIIIIGGSIFLSKSIGYTMGYSCIWLSALYLLGGIVRINQDWICHIFQTRKKKLLIGFIVYIILSISACAGYFMTINSVLSIFFRSYCSPFVVLGTLSLFIALFDLPIKNIVISKALEYLSSGALGVYLITENNWFRAKFITNKFAWVCDRDPLAGLLLVLGIGFAFFLIPLFVDAIRYSIFDRIGIYKLVKFTADWLTKLYDKYMDIIFQK